MVRKAVATVEAEAEAEVVVDMVVVVDRDLRADLLTALQTTEKDLLEVLKETTNGEVIEGQVCRTTDLRLMVTESHLRMILDAMVAMMDIKDLHSDLQEIETVETIAMEIATTEVAATEAAATT